MANPVQLKRLLRDTNVWNKWRDKNPALKIDLNGADLSEADLNGANLGEAHLFRADLHGTELIYANLREAYLLQTNLNGADLYKTDLIQANLIGAELIRADLTGANLGVADLSQANLSRAKLVQTDLLGANLTGANLTGANLIGANLAGADLSFANLRGAKLIGADLTRAYLCYSNLIQTKVNNAKISKSSIYGVNVWDLKGQFKEQNELIITPDGESKITVDNIKVAQFVYLILNNKEIRDVIDTLTSKTVLILGRFSIPERKEILDTIRNKLREFDLIPIVFDFDRPIDKDFTETIKTLAGLSYFVIADITNPRSSPLELQAIVPDYQIPFVPIIQEGEMPFSMFDNLQTKYPWMFNPISYDSLDTLIDILKVGIIEPAVKKHNELRMIKASTPTIISGKELRKKIKQGRL